MIVAPAPRAIVQTPRIANVTPIAFLEVVRLNILFLNVTRTNTLQEANSVDVVVAASVDVEEVVAAEAVETGTRKPASRML